MDYDRNDLQSVLVCMREQFGAGVFEEPSRMVAILSDLAPDLKREGNVLRQMSDAGLLRDLRTASESGAEHERIRLTAKSRLWLTDYLMLSDEKADYFMTALQAFYGLEEVVLPPISRPPIEPPESVIMNSGRTGSCTWTLDSNRVLKISGQWRMGAYGVYDSPWWDYSNSIEVIVIEHGVASIGSYNFQDCSNLKSVTIPDSVTSIGEGAFSDCSHLTTVTIPDGVTSIKANTFNGCFSLTGVTIPNSVTSIGESAFENCDSMNSVTIPDSVTSIKSSAFKGCSKLASVIIPDSVISIGKYAFEDCNSLNQVRVSRWTKIAPNAFDNETQIILR